MSCCRARQTALFNPFTLVSECFGPKVCGHIKHLVCCAVFLAIIVFGAPVFNAIIPIVRWAALAGDSDRRS